MYVCMRTLCRRSAHHLTTPDSTTALLLARALAVIAADAGERIARAERQRDLVLRTLAGLPHCSEKVLESQHCTQHNQQNRLIYGAVANTCQCFLVRSPTLFVVSSISRTGRLRQLGSATAKKYVTLNYPLSLPK